MNATTSSGILDNTSSNNSWYNNISWITIFLIIIMLALLGINIFVYLADGTKNISDILGATLKKIFYTSGDVTSEVTKDVVQGSADGLKKGVDTIENTIINTVDAVTGKNGIIGDISQPSTEQNEVIKTNTQNKGVSYEDVRCKDGCPFPSANELNTTDKFGWCLIGEENGERSCIEINQNDMCMSGDIYPSRNVCINPNLRK